MGRGIANYSNGNVHKRDVKVNLLKKRSWSQNNYKEKKSNFNGTHMRRIHRRAYSKYNESKRRKGEYHYSYSSQQLAKVILIISNVNNSSHAIFQYSIVQSPFICSSSEELL
ncbi:hypothetical protein JHK87_028415 [Glycine soja]|nr:hypothetical protein JHK87_028415 [Glycine soja]